jgi:uncharacterized protein
MQAKHSLYPDAYGLGTWSGSGEAEQTAAADLAVTALRAHPGEGWSAAWKRRLFLWRVGRRGAAGQAWLRWLATPTMARLALLHPGLYKKITRPYLTPAWGPEQVLAAAQAHYAFCLRTWGEANVQRILSPGGVTLATTGDGGEQAYAIRLETDGTFNKEGEMVLRLVHGAAAQPVCALAFVLHHGRDGRRQLTIGALQGANFGEPAGLIKSCAKACHGMRPKALLLFAAQELAAGLGIDRIEAVSDAGHISRHADYRFNRSRRPELEYDQFWAESGGRAVTGAFWELPAEFRPRELAAIKPNKRSLYRQRYEWLGRLGADLRAQLRDLAESREIGDALPPALRAS